MLKILTSRRMEQKKTPEPVIPVEQQPEPTEKSKLASGLKQGANVEQVHLEVKVSADEVVALKESPKSTKEVNGKPVSPVQRGKRRTKKP